MIVFVPVTGLLTTNAYFYIDDNTRHGFLIDPGAEADTLLNVVREKGFIIEKILLTHGHFDHMAAANELHQILSVPICMHENGRAYAEDPRWNLSAEYGFPIVLPHVDYLSDGSRIALKANPGFSVTMRHVPGHTTDGVFYYADQESVAFVGDTIFKNSYGATHFYGGDAEILMQSITKRILTLPKDTVLLSGHSEPTTVQEERERPWYAPHI